MNTNAEQGPLPGDDDEVRGSGEKSVCQGPGCRLRPAVYGGGEVCLDSGFLSMYINIHIIYYIWIKMAAAAVDSEIKDKGAMGT